MLSAGPTPEVPLETWDTAAGFAIASCDGGYTTNLPLEDLTGGRASVAFG